MSNATPSESSLEKDIAELRDRLAETIDELTERAAPKNVVAREKAKARASLHNATYTESGDLRMDRVAIAAAVVAGVVLLKVVASRRKKRW
ncbi:hypothetical protein GCM10022199_15280 [Marihabitans asiaticum]|uniref:Uncharacterized protein DUF3618 n=1 Tax=Marihabitans asiaticum TaxID=415218 RepID=A0A560W820_9MICO|nr:DUF3618 domain-containing protein [Marihabitans asiaticum]TWD13782.1 uncharacterized protein DUF3618 [Marihabitans asiaticum]